MPDEKDLRAQIEQFQAKIKELENIRLTDSAAKKQAAEHIDMLRAEIQNLKNEISELTQKKEPAKKENSFLDDILNLGD